MRKLTAEEAARLRRASRQATVFAVRHRAQVLLASDAGAAPKLIAQVLRTDERQVRRVIDEFDAEGMESLRLPAGNGHPGSSDGVARERAPDADRRVNGPHPNGPHVGGTHGNGEHVNGRQASDPGLGDPDVTDLLAVLHRRRWWIGVVMALAALIGYGLGSRSPVENRAETRLLLVDASGEGVLATAPAPLPLDERQSAVISRVESQRTRAEVIEALGLEPGDVKSIAAEAEEGESFVSITVTTVEGVDTAAITDQVAASVIAQQRDAVRQRFDALAGELRQAATEIDAEIAAVDARLEPTAREIAALQVEVDRSTGTDAGVDPLAELALKTDIADGLRSDRASLLATQSDFERRAKEADVAAAVSSGGLEVYAPAGAAHTTRTLPPAQHGVLLASLGLVVMVGAAYFTAYRADTRPSAPRGTIDPGSDGRTATPPERSRRDDADWGDEGSADNAERT